LPVVVEWYITRDIIGASQAGFDLSVQINSGFDYGEVDKGAEPDAFFKMFELSENPEQKT
jgi:hypothetical protein